MQPPANDATDPVPPGDTGVGGVPSDGDVEVLGDDQPTGVVPAPPAGPPLNPGRMRRERDRLMEKRQETLYHLGGLAFELYRRDMLTEPVMRRRAEEVAEIDRGVFEIDAALATVDEDRRARREAKREQQRAAREERDKLKRPEGTCVSCGQPYAWGANFCLNCGSPIVRPEPEPETEIVDEATASQDTQTVEPEGPQETQVIDPERPS